jgi:phytoene dehydrogenase-like protein
MTADVAVVGGGLGGLAAATYLARGGHSVVLCEKAAALGGRAATTAIDAFRFNLGPHALYAASHGIAVLRELGVAFTGAKPSASGAFAVARGAKHALPGGFLSLVTTGLFGLPAKLETARLLAGFGRVDVRPLARLSMREWIDATVRHPDVRELVGALVRVSTYSHDPERLSAAARSRRCRARWPAASSTSTAAGRRWSTACAAAAAAGVRIVTSARAASVTRAGAGWAVQLADGSTIDSRAAIVAAGPDAAAALLQGPEQPTVRRWADAAIPVRAACLDLALARLPQPRAAFALGIDRPLYLSVHSAYAALGPRDNAVIHVAKYLGRAASDPRADERELEGLMDLIHPGWRDLVLQRRFLPDMLVTHALPAAATGGSAERPGPPVPGAEDLYVVGDWVGPQGMLADASLASAKQAASMILQGATRSARAAA